MHQRRELSTDIEKWGEHLSVGSYRYNEEGGKAYIWKPEDEAIVTLVSNNEDTEIIRKLLESHPTYHDPSNKWAYADKSLSSVSHKPELPVNDEELRAYVETAIRHQDKDDEWTL